MTFCLYFIMKLYTMCPNKLYTMLPDYTVLDGPCHRAHRRDRRPRRSLPAAPRRGDSQSARNKAAEVLPPKAPLPRAVEDASPYTRQMGTVYFL